MCSPASTALRRDYEPSARTEASERPRREAAARPRTSDRRPRPSGERRQRERQRDRSRAGRRAGPGRASRRAPDRTSDAATDAAAVDEPPRASANRRRAVAQESPRRQLESFNPATGELIGTVETLDARQGAGGRRRRRRGAALLGAAHARGPRPLHAPRRRRAASRSSTRSPSCSPASRASRRTESYTMELAPHDRRPQLVADNGPEILADEKLSHAQALPQVEAAPSSPTSRSASSA